MICTNTIPIYIIGLLGTSCLALLYWTGCALIIALRRRSIRDYTRFIDETYTQYDKQVPNFIRRYYKLEAAAYNRAVGRWPFRLWLKPISVDWPPEPAADKKPTPGSKRPNVRK